MQPGGIPPSMKNDEQYLAYQLTDNMDQVFDLN